MTPQGGWIVLAAYRPDPELFARQLRSIQDQTLTEWTCVISVDGEADVVHRVLEETLGGDVRFRVVSDGTRRGFYLNFERGLLEVPDDADWVALSDQDDYWYPDKLAALTARLDEAPLASGQARLVRHPSGEVTGVTDRAFHGGAQLVLANQVTGSLCVFRGEILATALPFPRVPTRVETHDHWLAVVAATYGELAIVEDVVQDYVQHGANVYGDPSQQRAMGLAETMRVTLAKTRRYEGSASPLAVLRMMFLVQVGWRQVIVEVLEGRGRPVPPDIAASFGRRRRLVPMRRVQRAAEENGTMVRRSSVEYLIGWAAGALTGGRRRAHSLAVAALADRPSR
ncbi:glycosyltransferase [Microbacterium sp. 1.5R]|uniref:glycosyltransferase n=1 Tax=Microbacterium sp. 1.5R TaxID=1916917 RepID=UPI0016432BD8|nr:glycosyltransferase [Microbacterium sp. 1.5R]